MTDTAGRIIVPIPVYPYYYVSDLDQSEVAEKVGAATQQVRPPFLWAQWSQLPEDERVVEMKEWSQEYTSLDENDVVGHHGSRPPFPYFDSLDVDEKEEFDIGRADSLTGATLANADADSPGWFQMLHDDGVMDGYLDLDSGDPAGLDIVHASYCDVASGDVEGAESSQAAHIFGALSSPELPASSEADAIKALVAPMIDPLGL